MTSMPDDKEPAPGTDTLDALAGRIRLALGRPDGPGPSAELGRAYLAELDRHLAAGRLLDMGILEQRAG